jgi:hypothetical protein
LKSVKLEMMTSVFSEYRHFGTILLEACRIVTEIFLYRYVNMKEIRFFIDPAAQDIFLPCALETMKFLKASVVRTP